MTAVVISLTERRLARAGIKITFFKAMIKQSVLLSHYPGGLEPFLERYQSSELKEGLIAVTFMSLQQVDQFISEMQVHNIRKGHELALANQIHGVVCSCNGIKFVSLDRPTNAGTLMSFPVWYACADPD